MVNEAARGVGAWREGGGGVENRPKLVVRIFSCTNQR